MCARSLVKSYPLPVPPPSGLMEEDHGQARKRQGHQPAGQAGTAGQPARAAEESEEVNHQDLVTRLAVEGVLSPAWRRAFDATPRHWFIPDTIWVGDDLDPLSRADDPDGWMSAVYSDSPVVTQVDGRRSTSSASMPTAVASMLRRLDVSPGMRVLEIGTGTGFNAALLAHRLGSDNVVSVEVDSQLAEAARKALETSGRKPLVVTGDGANGWPAGAPYDRILSTAAVEKVPLSWIEQTRPGGFVLTPWGNSFYNGSLLRVDVDEDGGYGRIVDNAAFMHLRSQVWPLIDPDGFDVNSADQSVTSIHPWYVTGEDGAMLAIGHRVPNCIRFADVGDDGEVIVWFSDIDTGSWASLRYVPDTTEFEVRQSGPRRLWKEIEDAYEWWADAGEPGPDRYGVTVTPRGQTVWLDEPDRILPDPLNSASPKASQQDGP